VKHPPTNRNETRVLPRCTMIYVDESKARGYVLAVAFVPARYRRWLFQELAKTSIRYDHADRRSDALLWIPDAIAWCWQRGGEWRDKVRDAVTEVIEIDGS
jgi:hypothetical protein